MTSPIENRQHLSSSNMQELDKRELDVRELVDTVVGRSGDYFADPENRLEFIASQDAEGFYGLAQHINARLRGETPRLLRIDPEENGGFLPMLHTPSRDDKIPAFQNGFRSIQEYISDSDDAIDKKIANIAMATEALMIWVHPFNDGNGRTSRFMAKLIEDGATDIDSLVDETISANNRRRVYTQRFATKEGELEIANNDDIILDDNERDELRQSAETLPNDIDGMYLSIQRLMRDENVQQHTLRNVRVA